MVIRARGLEGAWQALLASCADANGFGKDDRAVVGSGRFDLGEVSMGDAAPMSLTAAEGAWRWILRDGIGVFLILGATTKWGDWDNSIAALAGRLGLRGARRVLPVLIVVEIVLGGALCFGIEVRAALLGSAALFLVFGLALMYWHSAGSSQPCGCFGFGIPSRISAITISRSFALAAACAFASVSLPVSGVFGGMGGRDVAVLWGPAVVAPILLVTLGALDALHATR